MENLNNTNTAVYESAGHTEHNFLFEGCDLFLGYMIVKAMNEDLAALKKAVRNKKTAQRKTCIVTHAVKYLLENAVSVIFTVKTALSECPAKVSLGIAIGYLALAIDIMELVRQSCLTRQSGREVDTVQKVLENLKTQSRNTGTALSDNEQESVDEIMHALEEKLAALKESHFRNKSHLFWHTLTTIASLLISLSFVCPMLLPAGTAVLLAALAGKYIDTHYDYKLSHSVAGFWNKHTRKNIKTRLPENFGFFHRKHSIKKVGAENNMVFSGLGKCMA